MIIRQSLNKQSTTVSLPKPAPGNLFKKSLRSDPSLSEVGKRTINSLETPWVWLWRANLITKAITFFGWCGMVTVCGGRLLFTMNSGPQQLLAGREAGSSSRSTATFKSRNDWLFRGWKDGAVSPDGLAGWSWSRYNREGARWIAALATQAKFLSAPLGPPSPTLLLARANRMGLRRRKTPKFACSWGEASPLVFSAKSSRKWGWKVGLL